MTFFAAIVAVLFIFPIFSFTIFYLYVSYQENFHHKQLTKIMHTLYKVLLQILFLSIVCFCFGTYTKFVR
jgi:hypothetical protein